MLKPEKKKLGFEFYWRVLILIVDIFFGIWGFISKTYLSPGTRVELLILGLFSLGYLIYAIIRKRMSWIIPTILLVIIVLIG